MARSIFRMCHFRSWRHFLGPTHPANKCTRDHLDCLAVHALIISSWLRLRVTRSTTTSLAPSCQEGLVSPPPKTKWPRILRTQYACIDRPPSTWEGGRKIADCTCCALCNKSVITGFNQASEFLAVKNYLLRACAVLCKLRQKSFYLK